MKKQSPSETEKRYFADWRPMTPQEVAFMRSLTSGERMCNVSRLNRVTRRMTRFIVRRQRPHWSDLQVHEEVTKRCSVYDVPKISAFDLMRKEFAEFRRNHQPDISRDGISHA